MKTLSAVIIFSLIASAAFAGPLMNAEEFQQKAVDNASQQGEEKMSQTSGSSLIQMADDQSGSGDAQPASSAPIDNSISDE